MKKISLIILTFFVCTFVNAQFQKGDVIIGGSISGSTSEYHYDNNPSNPQGKNRFLNISPVIGTALRNNLVAGVSLTYGSTNTDYISSRRKGNNYGAGVFVRRYYDLGKNFFVFGDLSANYNKSKVEDRNFLSSTVLTSRNWSAGLNLNPGVALAVTNHLHLEIGLTQLASIGYGHSRNTDNLNPSNGSKQNSFGFSTSLGSLDNFSLGLRVIL